MQPCDVRIDLHVPNSTSSAYGPDQSGTIRYDFNSCGYRGEEYDPTAKFKLCVIGESHSFGTGVSLEDTFGHRLKLHIAAALGLDSGEVNLTNLSVGGISADYCVRTIYRQIGDCDVDFLICHFPPPSRTEYADGKKFHPFGASAIALEGMEVAPAPLLAYCDYYNDHLGNINVVKNALLAQAFLKERGIGYVLATQNPLIGLKNVASVKAFAVRLDTSAVLQHEFFFSKADLAVDKLHAGPRSHAAFAIALLGFFGRLQMTRGNAELGSRLESHAAYLRANDGDWRHCNLHIAKKLRERKGGEP